MNEMRIDEKEMEKQDNADFEVNADEAGTVPENRCYTVEDLEAILSAVPVTGSRGKVLMNG